ncbi:MAG: putative Anti-sigma factor antagonist [Solirubrobacterales bacterium]|jgi:anti-sigma B factor antagonist|nr:putative Anti-sigma factor antagonist [Solirubrobacterales bacterium]
MSQLRTATLTLRADQEEDAICVVLFGELDIAGSPELGRALRDSIARHERVVVDLSGLDFLDSSGIEVLVEADLHARLADCRFEILRGPRPVQRVFDLCRASPQLPFAD